MWEAVLTAAWLTCSAVSVGTTEYALVNYPAQTREANLFMTQRSVRVTFNVAIPVAYFLTRPEMTKKQRYVFLGTALTVRAADMANNLVAVHRMKTGGKE